uniref:Probable magnesium-protoporphyrin IX monomethyl ester [oxidative] cyclase n=1 Tax=Gronococcus sybilensis TaxID=3028029 RepID=A0A9Y1MX42_9RHOD|nr:magnesium-protoporphyrin IX monomethyl ester cyclase [Gronococcus sybilensis]
MSNLKNDNVGTKNPSKETLLTPRFYTTDFEEMANYDVSSNQAEIEAVIEEFKKDYNKQHFIRDEEFDEVWASVDPTTKNLFVEFLERSCTAEFSGFLLYKELSRRLKNTNPLLAEGFLFMSRDEARHAGFLNKAMADFNLSLDLGFLTKSRKYTFFAPKFVFYATYLSEKIGYWRYITIYRHLEEHPEFRVYPLFKFFENWCQDENRHGDFFAALLKSQSNLLNGFRSRFWCKFFLLAVFSTMYLNDFQREDFYKTLGLDPRQFDIQVIKKTNESASRVFPVALDVDHQDFFKYLDICACKNRELLELGKVSTKSMKQIVRKIWLLTILVVNIAKLYLIPSINSKRLRDTVR